MWHVIMVSWMLNFELIKKWSDFQPDARAQVALAVKNLPANAGDSRDVGSIPGLGRSPGRGHGNPLQSSCLEKPVDRGAWGAPVHSVAELGMTEAP